MMKLIRSSLTIKMLSNLSFDIKWLITRYLDIESARNLALVNRNMANFFKLDKFWLYKCQYDIPDMIDTKPAILSWRVYYYRMLHCKIINIKSENVNVLSIYCFEQFTCSGLCILSLDCKIYIIGSRKYVECQDRALHIVNSGGKIYVIDLEHNLRQLDIHTYKLNPEIILPSVRQFYKNKNLSIYISMDDNLYISHDSQKYIFIDSHVKMFDHNIDRHSLLYVTYSGTLKMYQTITKIFDLKSLTCQSEKFTHILVEHGVRAISSHKYKHAEIEISCPDNHFIIASTDGRYYWVRLLFDQVKTFEEFKPIQTKYSGHPANLLNITI